MANYDNSAEMAKQMIFKFIKERMESRNISEYELEKLTGISRSTINRNLKNETEMTLSNFLKILGALKVNPYLVPKEIDKGDFQYIFFN